MQNETALYEFTKLVIGIMWRPEIYYFVGPFLVLRTVLRFLRWSKSVARGESASELQKDFTDVQNQYQARRETGRDLARTRGYVVRNRFR